MIMGKKIEFEVVELREQLEQLNAKVKT